MHAVIGWMDACMYPSSLQAATCHLVRCDGGQRMQPHGPTYISSCGQLGCVRLTQQVLPAGSSPGAFSNLSNLRRRLCCATVYPRVLPAGGLAGSEYRRALRRGCGSCFTAACIRRRDACRLAALHYYYALHLNVRVQKNKHYKTKLPGREIRTGHVSARRQGCRS